LNAWPIPPRCQPRAGAGVLIPAEAAVPLGTCTGWNIRLPQRRSLGCLGVKLYMNATTDRCGNIHEVGAQPIFRTGT